MSNTLIRRMSDTPDDSLLKLVWAKTDRDEEYMRKILLLAREYRLEQTMIGLNTPPSYHEKPWLEYKNIVGFLVGDDQWRKFDSFAIHVKRCVLPDEIDLIIPGHYLLSNGKKVRIEDLTGHLSGRSYFVYVDRLIVDISLSLQSLPPCNHVLYRGHKQVWNVITIIKYYLARGVKPPSQFEHYLTDDGQLLERWNRSSFGSIKPPV